MNSSWLYWFAWSAPASWKLAWIIAGTWLTTISTGRLDVWVNSRLPSESFESIQKTPPFLSRQFKRSDLGQISWHTCHHTCNLMVFQYHKISNLGKPRISFRKLQTAQASPPGWNVFHPRHLDNSLSIKRFNATSLRRRCGTFLVFFVRAAEPDVWNMPPLPPCIFDSQNLKKKTIKVGGQNWDKYQKEFAEHFP